MSFSSTTNLSNWLLAIRSKTLFVAVGPVLLGWALAIDDNGFHFWPAIGALAAAVLLQIAANLSNDYFHWKKGGDAATRLGSVRVMQGGLLSPLAVLVGAAVALFLATLIGWGLIIVGGWPIVLIGIAALLAAVFYTAGPYPLGYHGWGEVLVLVFFGLCAVGGTYYVTTLSCSWRVLWLSLPAGFLAVNVLLVNNIRDIESDMAAGKKTITVRIGPKRARQLFVLLLLISYLIPARLWLQGMVPVWAALLPLLVLLEVSMLARDIFHVHGVQMNSLLAESSKLVFYFCLLLAVGVLL